jgi:lipoprotein-anchoring transpeptidase ErfK/SrfK
MNEGIHLARAAGAGDATQDHDTTRRALSRRAALGLGAGLLGLAAAPGLALAAAEPFALPVGPRVTHIVVSKTNRVLELHVGKEIHRRYAIDLGFDPKGHKTSSGDGRTPEGRYWIDRRNPRSEFFLSLGISYPNAVDLARAEAMGVDPGGDIFIHGEPMRTAKRSRRDWTAGCIAVSNAEIEEIWTLTPVGVPITIFA